MVLSVTFVIQHSQNNTAYTAPAVQSAGNNNPSAVLLPVQVLGINHKRLLIDVEQVKDRRCPAVFSRPRACLRACVSAN